MGLSPDEKYLASVDGTGRIIVWDVANEEIHLDIVAHESRVADVLFHPFLPFLATAGMDGRIAITDLRSGEIVHELIGHSFGVVCLAFHPRSPRLVSGGNDFAIKVWDLHSGIELLSIESHRRSVGDIEFTADGEFIDSIDLDGMWIRHQGASSEVISQHDATDEDSRSDDPH